MKDSYYLSKNKKLSKNLKKSNFYNILKNLIKFLREINILKIENREGEN